MLCCMFMCIISSYTLKWYTNAPWISLNIIYKNTLILILPGHQLVLMGASRSYITLHQQTMNRSTGAGHIIRISSKSWFISLIPFKKWNLYNVYIHSTQTDIFQVFISFNFYDYKWQLMKTPNSVSQKIRILWKGSILKTPGATL